MLKPFIQYIMSIIREQSPPQITNLTVLHGHTSCVVHVAHLPGGKYFHNPQDCLHTPVFRRCTMCMIQPRDSTAPTKTQNQSLSQTKYPVTAATPTRKTLVQRDIDFSEKITSISLRSEAITPSTIHRLPAG